MTRRNLFALALAFALAANASPAYAGYATVQPVTASPFRVDYVTQPLFTSVTIQTLNLSSGADSVINVFDASWNPIAGNDDSGGTLASFVTIPGGSSVRLLIVVTRAYSQYDNGTATLESRSAALQVTRRSRWAERAPGP